METFTYEVTSFTFHELVKDKDNVTQSIGKNVEADQIEVIKGYLVGTSRDFAFQLRKNSHLGVDVWDVFCAAHPNSEAGLLMRCKGRARLSCFFESKSGGFTVVSSKAPGSDACFQDDRIYIYTIPEWSLLNGSLKNDIITHCRSPFNTITVSISSTPLPSAKILFDALRSGPPVSLKIQNRTWYDQDSWGIHLVSELDARNASTSDSSFVRAHRAVLERYAGFREVLMPELKVVGGSGSKAGEPSRKRTRGSGVDIKPDVTLLDADLMPKFDLEEDLQTIRAIVKFIYTGDIHLWVSHIIPDVGKSLAGCEAKAAWAAADRYRIAELKSAATRFIVKNLSIDTILSDLVLSRVSEELQILYKAYIKLNLVKVKHSPSVVEILRELSRNAYPTSSGDLLAEVLQKMTAEE